jgi:EpsI family protein
MRDSIPTPHAPERAVGDLLRRTATHPPRWPLLALALALAATFLATYAETIAKLIEHWSSNDMYSYGFLVPAISGYVVWLRRDHLRSLPIVPSYGAGLAVLAGGLAMFVVGRVGATNILEELSLPVTIWGLALLVFGRRVTKSLTFPLAYLFTMVPFWDVLTGRLHLPFQLYSAAAGVAALRLVNIPVFHYGTFIELPNITLEVAEVCSGVNNLVAVLCIGIPLTHYYVMGWWKRSAIVVAAILVALISNGIRVATVSLFAFYEIRGANGDIHGPFSLARSLVISGVGFLVLFWLIARFADRPKSRGETPLSPSPSLPAYASKRGPIIAAGLAIAIMAGAAALERRHFVEPVPLPARLIGFPATIGQWESSSGPMAASFLRALDFDDSLFRTYSAPDGTRVDLVLGYLAGQRQGRELGETGLLSSLGLSLPDSSDTRSLGSGEVRDMLASDGRKTAYLAYAYVIDGDVFAGDYKAKRIMMWNTFFHRRSNGGIVVVAGRAHPKETLDQARGRFSDFVEGVMAPSTLLLTAAR